MSKASHRALPRFVMLVTLLAFSIQTYLTQTHIHWQGDHPVSLATIPALVGHGNSVSRVSSERKDGYPANEDPANCPLCQEVIHAGQFVTPAAAALILPYFSISIIDVAVPTAPLARTVTHIWRGRAPPRR